MSAVSQRNRRIRRACDREAARQAEQGRLAAEGRAAWEEANDMPFPAFDTVEERQTFIREFIASDKGVERVGPECGKLLLDTLEHAWALGMKPGSMPPTKK